MALLATRTPARSELGRRWPTEDGLRTGLSTFGEAPTWNRQATAIDRLRSRWMGLDMSASYVAPKPASTVGGVGNPRFHSDLPLDYSLGEPAVTLPRLPRHRWPAEPPVDDP